jgi:methyl-accepting chemotaxis protein
MHIRNLRISSRLALGFCTVLLLTGLITVFGVVELKRINNAKARMMNAVEEKELAKEWLNGISINVVRTYAQAMTANSEDEAYFGNQIANSMPRANIMIKRIEQNLAHPVGRVMLSEIADKRAVYVRIHGEVFKLKKTGNINSQELRLMIDSKLIPAMEAYVAAVAKVLSYQEELLNVANDDIANIYQNGKDAMIIIGAASVLLGGLLSWCLSRSITVPLGQAIALAETVAAGNLTSKIHITASDETGALLQALQNMIDSLEGIVREVRYGAQSLEGTANEIAHGNSELSARTEMQAASLETAASSLEELTAAVSNNAECSERANDLVTNASHAAEKGGAVIANVVLKMNEISTSAHRIVDIISVIDGIAFQTNILALNAAVEAARAGPQGRGFAVVASEVRVLAQRSSDAAREITNLINESVVSVKSGADLVGIAGKAMSEIVESVHKVATIIGDVKMASREQAEGIAQINSTIAQLDHATQQNSTLVEEAAHSSCDMRNRAARLTESVAVFRLAEV